MPTPTIMLNIGDNMTVFTLLQLIGQFGVPIALVVFFVWNNNKREQKLVKRLEKLEDYTRDKLEKVVINYTEIVKSNTDVLGQVKRLLEK